MLLQSTATDQSRLIHLPANRELWFQLVGGGLELNTALISELMRQQPSMMVGNLEERFLEETEKSKQEPLRRDESMRQQMVVLDGSFTM